MANIQLKNSTHENYQPIRINGAFDIVSKQVGELKEQNKQLRTAIDAIMSEISNMDIPAMIDSPATFVEKVKNICVETYKLRPL
jgi:ketopantoate reductase